MERRDRIEKISMDPILAIAADYGRITIDDVWYQYDPRTDALIRCTSVMPSQTALFEEASHA